MHTKEYDIAQFIENDNVGKKLWQYVTPNDNTHE